MDDLKAWIEPPARGRYEGVDEEIYHAWNLLSNSQLTWAHRTLAYFNMRKFGPEPKRDSTAQANMDYGSGIHCIVLEPDTFEERFCRRPEGHPNSNAYKDKRDELVAEGFTVLKMDHYENCNRIRDRFFSISSMARDLVMEATATEVSYVGEVMGVPSKCRVDLPLPERGIIGEVKTTGDLSEGALMRRTNDLAYDQGCVFYLKCVDSVEPEQFNSHRTIWFQTTPPFESRVTILGEKSHILASDEMYPRIMSIAESMESGDWPGYPNEVIELNVPGWRFFKN